MFFVIVIVTIINIFSHQCFNCFCRTTLTFISICTYQNIISTYVFAIVKHFGISIITNI